MNQCHTDLRLRSRVHLQPTAVTPYIISSGLQLEGNSERLLLTSEYYCSRHGCAVDSFDELEPCHVSKTSQYHGESMANISTVVTHMVMHMEQHLWCAAFPSLPEAVTTRRLYI